MNAIEITIGKTYTIKNGKTTATAKVIDRDEEAQSWDCETEKGKRFTVKDSERFLEEIVTKSNIEQAASEPSADVVPEKPVIKSIFDRAAAAKIAAEHGFCTAEAAAAIAAEAATEAERLSQTAKEASARAAAAKTALEHGFCTAEVAEAAIAEAEAAKTALRAAGGSHRGGGRRQGAMSGLDAAYKILLETGIPMNPKAIANAAIEKGIWSPQGATPDMTLSAALQSDVKKKGDASRFAKAVTAGHYIARAAQ